MKAQIPKNIKKYKKTFILNFDLRQTLFIGFALFLSYLMNKWLGLYGLGVDVRMIIIAVICSLLITTGCFKHNGVYAEKILFNLLLDMLYNVNYRPFKNRGFDNEKK